LVQSGTIGMHVKMQDKKNHPTVDPSQSAQSNQSPVQNQPSVIIKFGFWKKSFKKKIFKKIFIFYLKSIYILIFFWNFN